MSSSKISPRQLDQVALLARLKLTRQEKSAFLSQLRQILTFVSQVQSVNTQKLPPTFQVTGLKNVTRKDRPGPCFSQKLALSTATACLKGYIVVPQTIKK